MTSKITLGIFQRLFLLFVPDFLSFILVLAIYWVALFFIPYSFHVPLPWLSVLRILVTCDPVILFPLLLFSNVFFFALHLFLLFYRVFCMWGLFANLFILNFVDWEPVRCSRVCFFIVFLFFLIFYCYPQHDSTSSSSVTVVVVVVVSAAGHFLRTHNASRSCAHVIDRLAESALASRHPHDRSRWYKDDHTWSSTGVLHSTMNGTN